MVKTVENYSFICQNIRIRIKPLKSNHFSEEHLYITLKWPKKKSFHIFTVMIFINLSDENIKILEN